MEKKPTTDSTDRTDPEQLALELMKRGSYQVEMSDEGLMTENIEECLSVIITALKKSDMPAADVLDLCSAMTANDRVGFVAERQLLSLRSHFQALAAR